MNPSTIVNVEVDGVFICQFDCENPDLTSFVNAVITNEKIIAEKVKCTSEMEDFDIVSFEELVRQTIKDIRESLKNELDRYDQIRSTIILDQKVDEYFTELTQRKLVACK